jgi:hypothetical protein
MMSAIRGYVSLISTGHGFYDFSNAYEGHTENVTATHAEKASNHKANAVFPGQGY